MLTSADLIRMRGRITEIDVRLKTMEAEREALVGERRQLRNTLAAYSDEPPAVMVPTLPDNETVLRSSPVKVIE